MKRASYDRLDDLGKTTAFIARGHHSIGVIVRLLAKKGPQPELLTDEEWHDLAWLVHAAPAMRQAIKKASFLADVEAANVDQTPAERDRWLSIKSILHEPFQAPHP
jgi:hypothetical protein